MAATIITATQLAEQLKTDPRTARKFLRDELGKVGKGNRHEIKAGQVATLRKKFAAWEKSREVAAKAKAEKAKAEAAPAVLPEGNELTQPVTADQAKGEKAAAKKAAPKPAAKKGKVTELPPTGATKAKLDEAKK